LNNTYKNLNHIDNLFQNLGKKDHNSNQSANIDFNFDQISKRQRNKNYDISNKKGNFMILKLLINLKNHIFYKNIL